MTNYWEIEGLSYDIANGSGRIIGLTILPIHTLASGCYHTYFLFCCCTYLQTSMNVTQQMEDVNTIVLTPLGASTAAVTQDTSWMKID